MNEVIKLINPFTGKSVTRDGQRLIDEDGNLFPLVDGAFRFVTGENYTQNFGFQWNKFQKTQIDRFQQNSKQSRERFFAVTGWDKQDLTGKNVLEVGSGAGRFSQVVLHDTKANLYSVDYSNAVAANFGNNGPHPRLNLFQASIYELPFSPAQFDKVFCFGVLQHTPDFKKSIGSLVDMVKPGGELIIDFYPIRGWYTKIHSKYLLRSFTRKMNHDQLLSRIESNIDRLIAAYEFFNKIGVGRVVNRFLPICDIDRTIPHQLDHATRREWAILDTFDMFSPAYDDPQRVATVVEWLKMFNMQDVNGFRVAYGDGNEVSGVKATK